ncbi:MAG: ABC transporter ATP-binding protein [Limnohabitans sp.]|nr:ABC transporter ATP-binding protein [Limnohabitans sp.]
MFLNINDLQVQYPGREAAAVNRVSLSLEAGSMGVLIGPSGCGKTTLLRAVAGLEKPRRGSIEIDGQTVSGPGIHIAPEFRRIGMVFQDYALFPHLNLADNITFGLHRWPANKQRARVKEMLELVGLEKSGQRFAHELSGGQQQRVALARALAPGPQLLLLDEPFSNLDVDLRERLAHELRVILQQAKTTALFVTHDQLEAFALGDVIGVMHQGCLLQWADAYKLYHRPATRFVAEFIGHGVFAPATLIQQADTLVLQTPLGEIREKLNPNTPIPITGECDVLLRADDIVHDDASLVKAQIIRKAFRGSEFLYTLNLASGHTLLAHVPSHHDHDIGEWIGIRAEVDHVVMFSR